jgi:molybdopterin synthase catalytic subunit
MTVALKPAAFDPYQELLAYQSRRRPGSWGATASFVGTMRDFNEGDAVHGMLLEHYPGMTEQALADLEAEAARRWRILDSLIVHRTGEIKPGEPIVLVAVWAEHRAEAFEACRHLIETLKSTVPFWKKETTPEGERWVEHNTPAKGTRFE